MLARPNRMTSPADFAVTIKRGRKARAGSLVTYVLAPTGVGSPEGIVTAPSTAAHDPADRDPVRVGLVVNRRVANSVGRHRIARVLRATVRGWLGSFPAGSSLVIRALPGCANRSNQRIAADLAAALRKLQAPGQPLNKAVASVGGGL